MTKKISASTILYNGKIYSMDETNSTYEAIALSGNRIMALGKDDYISAFKNRETKMINLEGKTVVPGLIDSHTHFAWASRSEIDSELYIPKSIESLLNYLKEKCETLPEGTWIHFKNTYPTRLKENRYPTKEELDAVSPSHPVFVDGAYAGVANTKALAIANINSSTPQPTTGKYITDENGEPTGVFFKCNELIVNHIPLITFSYEDHIEGFKKLQYLYNKLGITSVIDGISDIPLINSVNALNESEELSLRLTYTVLCQTPEEIKDKVDKLKEMIDTSSEWSNLKFVKVMIDGGILTGTAYMRDPYSDIIGIFNFDIEEFKGVLNIDTKSILPFIEEAKKAKMQMTAHCIGDAAIDELVKAYEIVNENSSIVDNRYGIIHCDFTDDAILNRIKNLGLNIFFQPAWYYKDADVLNKIICPEIMNTFMPYKKYIDLDIHASSGSDHMVKYDSFESENPYNPFLAMYNMITRKTQNDNIIGEEHTISRLDAIIFYTRKAAYSTFDEDNKGTLNPGKLADMVVLSDDYFNCEEDEIMKIEAILTICDGKIVYEA